MKKPCLCWVKRKHGLEHCGRGAKPWDAVADGKRLGRLWMCHRHADAMAKTRRVIVLRVDLRRKIQAWQQPRSSPTGDIGNVTQRRK